jgi:hypothetical protein
MQNELAASLAIKEGNDDVVIVGSDSSHSLGSSVG